MTAVAEQGRLPLVVRPQIIEAVGDDVIDRLPDMQSALVLAITASGLQEKQIHLELKIAAAQWTRIKSGQAHFPQNLLCEFMDIVGNEIPLRWLAMHRGYGLVRLRTEVEAENETLRAQNAALQEKLAHFEEFLTITKR
ncbi:hypothetical protein [Hahella ganghwensis]|uniref:hypothetical protein n=1 Tax=Hahella ganghwensis TaxID=286420 RepID=UPI000380BAAC|nr:hypothetical protein [Hahella ganghwensis]